MKNISNLFVSLKTLSQFFFECWPILSKTNKILIIFILLLIYIFLFGSFSTIVGISLSMWLGFKVAALKTTKEEANSRNYQKRSKEEKTQVLTALKEEPTMSHREVGELFSIPRSTVTFIKNSETDVEE